MISHVDRYDGVTIDPESIPDSVGQFETELQELLVSVQDKQLLWIKVPIEKSFAVPVLTENGFTFHHTDETALMLVKKLAKDPIVPTPKNYTLGVGAVVIDKGNLLVIKDRFQPGYKLPGGHVDHREPIVEAMVREVKEETGVDVSFESILNVGHFTRGQFGESNIYLVCTGTALSRDIDIQDSVEILEARWMPVQEFLDHEETNNYNRSVVQAALENSELKLLHRDIQLRIPVGYEVFL